MCLDTQIRKRVVTLKKQGYTYRSIKTEDEGTTVSIKTLYLLVAKFYNTGMVADRPQDKREKLLNDEHYHDIDIALSENDHQATTQPTTRTFSWTNGFLEHCIKSVL